MGPKPLHSASSGSIPTTYVQYGHAPTFSTRSCCLISFTIPAPSTKYLYLSLSFGQLTDDRGRVCAVVVMGGNMSVPALLVLLAPSINPPGSAALSAMLIRWVHFVAGITWVGLLYFFNLVNVPFMKEMDSAAKAKIVPSLMPRALWWFRWSAVITVLAGLAYWGKNIVAV